MKAIVVDYDSINNFFTVETENRRYIVFEPIGGYEVSINDEIKGNFDSLGSEQLFNISQNEYIDVVIQEIK